MERERPRSAEEEDTLERSTKKFKEVHYENNTLFEPLGNGDKVRSYRDKLVGSIPGAYEQAFGFASGMDEEVYSNDEDDELCEGMVSLKLSKEEKSRIRAPWGNAIFVKVFGRSLGYTFLAERLRSMWKPVGRMDCVNVGHDFFLIKFELKSDLDDVIKGGPWFVGQQFLAIRLWELEFKASLASCSSVAVWVRLPELPIEFYEPTILKKIGKTIGPVLRIDSHTLNGERGRFARVCVQIDVNKPLVRSIKIGRMIQPVQYEGLNSLCFACGRLGHRKEQCPSIIKKPGSPMETPVDVSSDSSTYMEDHVSGANAEHDLYGEWMVVKRKKKPPIKVQGPRRDDSFTVTMQRDASFVGGSVCYSPRDPNADAGKDMKRKVGPSHGYDGTSPISSQRNSHPGEQNRPFVTNKSKNLVRSRGGSPKSSQYHGFNSNTSGWDSRPWPSKPTANTISESLPLPAFEFQFGATSNANESVRREVGYLPQRKGDSNW